MLLSQIYIHKEAVVQYILICGSLRIIFDSDKFLLKEVEKIVNDYNENLYKQKTMHMSMQMKMEGF